MFTQLVVGLLLFLPLAVFFVRVISFRKDGAVSAGDIRSKGRLELDRSEQGIATWTGQP